MEAATSEFPTAYSRKRRQKRRFRPVHRCKSAALVGKQLVRSGILGELGDRE
jgi:hypothetical protein